MRASPWIAGLLVLGLVATSSAATSDPAKPTASTQPSAAKTKAPGAAPPRVDAERAPANGHVATTHAPANAAGHTPVGGGGGEVTETTSSNPPRAKAGSIAAARDAIRRAIATSTGSAANPTMPAQAAAPLHAPTAGPAGARRAPPATGTTARRAVAPTARAAPGITLRWPDVPTGARTLTWEPDVDPRGTPLGVRLVWMPEAP